MSEFAKSFYINSQNATNVTKHCGPRVDVENHILSVTVIGRPNTTL